MKKDYDDLIDEWHNDKSLTMELHEYLGMSLNTYQKWVKDPTIFDREREEYVQGLPFTD